MRFDGNKLKIAKNMWDNSMIDRMKIGDLLDVQILEPVSGITMQVNISGGDCLTEYVRK